MADQCSWAYVEGEELVPLYGELYSQEAKGFRSENRQILNALDHVVEWIGGRGIWAIDPEGFHSGGRKKGEGFESCLGLSLPPSTRSDGQAYNLENVRVLSYRALRNIVVMGQAVFYFVSVELGKKLKLNILLKKIFEKAKRFFEIPEFKQYAIADGVYQILFASKTGIIPRLLRKHEKGQLLLPFALEIS